jgi:urea transport system ATP-binding protein
MTAPILSIENLTVSFGGFKALNHLNFALDPGELRVIIGPNGAGKTTFLDVITGKVQPTIGKVKFKGQDLRKIPEYRIARLGVGRKFQTPRVYLNLTVRENLDLVANRKKNVLPTLFSQSSATETRSVAGLLETVGLVAKAELPAALLSHGEKQRLEIGMLVAQSPDLLLVDEPVAGLTDEETENVGALLLALAESHSIIVIEHDMEFVRQIARKVTVLHQGTVLCEGTMDEVQNDPRVIEVYLGQESSLSPQQLKILRIIAAIAAADGNISPAETDVIVADLSRFFSHEVEDPDQLKEELKDYLLQPVDATGLIDEITDQSEKELLAQVSYDVMQVSDSDDVSLKQQLYYQIRDRLALPPEIIRKIEGN